MSKGHIAFYIGSFQRGGAERVMANLAEYFYTQDYQVTLVTTYLAEEEYPFAHAAWKRISLSERGAHPQAEEVMLLDESPALVDPFGGCGRDGIHRVFSGLLPGEQTSNRAANIARRSAKLRRVFEKIRPDVIVSFLGKNNVMAILTTIGLGIPVLVSVRSDPAREYASSQLRFSMRSAYPRAAGVILQTQDAINYFPHNIREKCVILPNPLNPEFIRPPYEGEREKTIVAVGSLDRNKNHAMLIKAFASLRLRHPDYKLILYGEGAEHRHLDTLVASLKLKDSVQIAGKIDGIADAIYQAGCFVLPSDVEGMPNALIEAMAEGLPCVSTDCPCGGPRELIREGETGLLFPVGDTAMLETSLARILDNPKMAKRLGEQASLEIQAKFAPEVANTQWEAYISGVMKHHAV